ncbi:MAG: hypothetical protein KKG00_03245 [Bacteroidetes bacterium]|nr:hypothetical protein [Bacteroidota bacterium]
MKLNQMRLFEIEESIKDKCFTLTSLILAQYDITALRHPYGEYWCIFTNDFQSKFNTNFMMELTSLIGLLRAVMDIESINIPVKNENYGFDQSVGILTIDTSNEPLSYREACNKIIHADSYQIQFSYSEKHPLFDERNGYDNEESRSFKNPMLVTRGKYRGKIWISDLNFLKFIDASMKLHME